MSTANNAIIYKRAKIEGNSLGDEVVFFDDRVGKYFATGQVGADIWKLLETPMSLDSLVAKLLDLYEVDEETCRNQTKLFVDRMVEVALIEAN